MLGWLRRRRDFRQRVEAKAARLMDSLGYDALPTAYDESRDLSLTDEERRFNMAVRRAIEKRLGGVPQPDTATRYEDWRRC
jgi:hypothetical protein